MNTGHGLKYRSPIAKVFGRLLCWCGFHNEFLTKRRWSERPKFSAVDNGKVWVTHACHRCKWRALKELV